MSSGDSIELRDAIAEIVAERMFASDLRAKRQFEVADRILALPEIAEALKVRNAWLADQMPDLPTERVGEILRGLRPPK